MRNQGLVLDGSRVGVYHYQIILYRQHGRVSMNAQVTTLMQYARGEVEVPPDEILKVIHETLEMIHRQREVSRRVFAEDMDKIERALKDLANA